MNPTIAKYREAIERQRAGGFDLTMVSVADLAALCDIAEAADAVVTNWRGSSVSGRFASTGHARDQLDKIYAALARLGAKP